VIATGNIGCATQIARFSTTAIVHTVELIDWATGGSRPRGFQPRSGSKENDPHFTRSGANHRFGSAEGRPIALPEAPRRRGSRRGRPHDCLRSRGWFVQSAPTDRDGQGVRALALGVSSRVIGEMAIERPTFISAAGLNPAGIVPAAGGVLIRDGVGTIVGAVGVTGDTSDNDGKAAMAGIVAAGLAA